MRTRSTLQSGSSILEFAIVIPLFTLMLYGVFTTGMSISKAQQVSTLTREAGTMFLRFVDFSIPGNQALLIRQASGLGLTAGGGNGVIVLSAFKMIGEGDCIAGGFEPRNCPNFGYPVVVKRHLIGNKDLFKSTFGAPEAAFFEENGTIPASKYLTDTGCRAEKLDTLVALAAGENAYLSEGFFRTPELDIPGYQRDSTIYQRAIF